MEMANPKSAKSQHKNAKDVSEQLPKENSPEFHNQCDKVLQKVAAKYAWTAQQGGIVLRNNPLKLPPLQDYVFNRISRADNGVPYRDKAGRKKVWWPKFEFVLAALDEPDADFGFIIAERIEFLPGETEVTHDADGCRVLNLWRPPKWQINDDLPEPKLFLRHLAYLLNDNQGAIEHVLDFLAHLVQHPHERVSHALLITSEAKGIGKSTLGIIVRKLVGEQNSRVAQAKDLKSSFDGWLMGKLVVQVDEVYEAGNWDLANKLKPLITEPTVSANLKYGPQIEIENYARFLLFSNHTAPLSIEEGDRRYFVFNSKAQPRDDGYYEELHHYIESNAGMNAIYTFLQRRDISGFNPHKRPPMTDAKQAIIETSGHPLRTYIIDAVGSGHLREHLGDEFAMDKLQRQLQKDGFGPQSKNLKELSEALEAAGVTQFRKQTKDGRRPRRWKRPQTEEDDGGPISF